MIVYFGCYAKDGDATLIWSSADLRKAVWHFRHGGIRQVQTFVRRRRLDSTFGGGVAIPGGTGVLSALRTPPYAKLLGGRLGSYQSLQWEGPFSSYRIGLIADEFSAAAWSKEFSTFSVVSNQLPSLGEVKTWSFLLVESAWLGAASSWKGKLTNGVPPEFVELKKLANSAGVPVVFWNKEDPPHFADFFPIARMCDYVFTSAVEMVERYANVLGQDCVGVLQFAASTPMHNPVKWNSFPERTGVAFAGTFYRNKFEERGQNLVALLRGAISAAKDKHEPVVIFSRHAGGPERYQFPKEFKDYLGGAIPYSEVLTAYRRFKAFINVDSVVDSQTMMSRRVWELIACGTPVVSAHSPAGQLFEGSGLFRASSASEAKDVVTKLLESKDVVEREVHRGQRIIWEGHTYTHRAEQILLAVGKIDDVGERSSLTSIIIPTKRPAQIEHIVSQVAGQKGVNFEVLIGLHGFTLDDWAKRRILENLESNSGFRRIEFLDIPVHESLGTVLKRLSRAAQGEYVARFDDDDYYFPNYLRDQVNTLRWSQADIVGKGCTYVYLSNSDLLIRRRPDSEHHWSELVAGATLVIRANVLADIEFEDRKVGEDSSFLRRAVQRGYKIYSADRFNYVTVRSSSHTWKISDTDLMAGGQVEGTALQMSRVIV